ncbi:MAG: 23S rRNA (guanosine(2251)-2'-O)-methyltransferase RlmB [Spirochaetota bacterium]
MFITAKNVIAEALKAGTVKRLLVDESESKQRVRELADLAARQDVRVEYLPRTTLRKTTETSAPIVAEVSDTPLAAYSAASLAEMAKAAGKCPLILMLDGITDVHNLGAIMRSAHYFGAAGVVLPKDNSARVTTDVHRTSAGASYHIPTVTVVNLSQAVAELKDLGFWIYAADGKGDIPLADAKFDTPSVLIMGSEHGGVRQKLYEKADFRVRIEHYGGFDSLNVSTAAAVFLYGWRMKNPVVQGK